LKKTEEALKEIANVINNTVELLRPSKEEVPEIKKENEVSVNKIEEEKIPIISDSKQIPKDDLNFKTTEFISNESITKESEPKIFPIQNTTETKLNEMTQFLDMERQTHLPPSSKSVQVNEQPTTQVTITKVITTETTEIDVISEPMKPEFASKEEIVEKSKPQQQFPTLEETKTQAPLPVGPTWASIVSSVVPAEPVNNIITEENTIQEHKSRPVIHVQEYEPLPEPVTKTDSEGYLEIVSKREKHRRRSRTRSGQSISESEEVFEQKPEPEKKKKKSKKTKKEKVQDDTTPENLQLKEPVEDETKNLVSTEDLITKSTINQEVESIVQKLPDMFGAQIINQFIENEKQMQTPTSTHKKTIVQPSQQLIDIERETVQVPEEIEKEVAIINQNIQEPEVITTTTQTITTIKTIIHDNLVQNKEPELPIEDDYIIVETDDLKAINEDILISNLSQDKNYTSKNTEEVTQETIPEIIEHKVEKTPQVEKIVIKHKPESKDETLFQIKKEVEIPAIKEDPHQHNLLDNLYKDIKIWQFKHQTNAAEKDWIVKMLQKPIEQPQQDKDDNVSNQEQFDLVLTEEIIQKPRDQTIVEQKSVSSTYENIENSEQKLLPTGRTWASIVSTATENEPDVDTTVKENDVLEPKLHLRPTIHVQEYEPLPEPVTKVDSDGFLEIVSKREKHRRRSRTRSGQSISESEEVPVQQQDFEPEKKQKKKKSKKK